MPTPEELAKQEAEKKAKEAAEAAAAEAKAKLEQEAKEKAEAAIKAEAEKKVAEEQRLSDINEAAKVEAEKLVKEALSKQEHDRAVARNVYRLQSEQEFGQGDPAKLRMTMELAKRGLAAVDPDGKLAALLEKEGLSEQQDVLRAFVTLGNAVANDTFKIPGSQPPLPKQPLTLQEKVQRWDGTKYVP